MSKMQNLSIVEKEIFGFLRKAFRLNRKEVRLEFERLFNELNNLQSDPQQSRSFMYLDILSWLESRIRNVPVQTIIRAQYMKRTAEKG
jgi:hypothetical protein